MLTVFFLFSLNRSRGPINPLHVSTATLNSPLIVLLSSLSLLLRSVLLVLVIKQLGGLENETVPS